MGKTVDYRNPETEEVREFDIPFGEDIPTILEVEGVQWKRVFGAPIHMPIHMQSKHDHWRANFKGPSGSPTGKKTIY